MNLILIIRRMFCRKDFVPIIPGMQTVNFFVIYFMNSNVHELRLWLGRDMGYHHPSGEVHIMENNEWVYCPGKKNSYYFRGEKKKRKGTYLAII